MGRNTNTGEAARFMGLIIKLMVALIVIFGVYYIMNKTDIINKVKDKSQKTIEEITDVSFSDIDHINTETEKNIPIEAFKNEYKDKKYKLETDVKKLSEDGSITYYIYGDRNTYEYKLFDLGDGYIKIVKDTAAIYKEVK